MQETFTLLLLLLLAGLTRVQAQSLIVTTKDGVITRPDFVLRKKRATIPSGKVALFFIQNRSVYFTNSAFCKNSKDFCTLSIGVKLYSSTSTTIFFIPDFSAFSKIGLKSIGPAPTSA